MIQVIKTTGHERGKRCTIEIWLMQPTQSSLARYAGLSTLRVPGLVGRDRSTFTAFGLCPISAAGRTRPSGFERVPFVTTGAGPHGRLQRLPATFWANHIGIKDFIKTIIDLIFVEISQKGLNAGRMPVLSAATQIGVQFGAFQFRQNHLKWAALRHHELRQGTNAKTAVDRVVQTREIVDLDVCVGAVVHGFQNLLKPIHPSVKR